MRLKIVLLALCAVVAACGGNRGKSDEGYSGGEATRFTLEANAQTSSQIDAIDAQDYDDAMRGFIATYPDLEIGTDQGDTIWNMRQYAFLDSPQSVPTVNPDVWRRARLNMANGLFEVVPGIYQVRGFDLANMTLVEGRTGLIVIDPLGSAESSKRGMDLYLLNRPAKPVKAVIYTRPYISHYGGASGVISGNDTQVQIIAPEEFLEFAVKEDIYAGSAVSRRIDSRVGALLPASAKGKVDADLGKAVAAGTHSLIAPNRVVAIPGQRLHIDGVEIIMQVAPDGLAPVIQAMYFPDFKAICLAQNCSALYGNGAVNAKAWWKALNGVLDNFGAGAEVLFFGHQWPVWGNDRVVALLSAQRNLYKYLHDRTLNLINRGYAQDEVESMVSLPAELDRLFRNRGYYGPVSEDIHALYQAYAGSDATPDELSPRDQATKYIEYMGGVKAVVAKAKKDFKAGNYRWVAQVMEQVVLVDAQNKPGRLLAADALEQLGYQADNALDRNRFLTRAYELRNGQADPAIRLSNPAAIRAMDLDMLFDYMGIRLDADKAEAARIVINFEALDTRERYLLSLEDGVLIYTRDKQSQHPAATLSVSSCTDLAEVVAGSATLQKQIEAGKISVKGDRASVMNLFALLD